MKRAVLGLYRVRGAILLVAVIGILATIPLRIIAPGLGDVATIVIRVGIGGLALVAILALVGWRLLPQHPPTDVAAPVTGRWLAVNSPTTKVPSHGVRAYGQAYAIDLVLDPESPDTARPQFSSGRAFRAPAEYPAFGQPVRAMVDGVVVTASDGLRDHRARSNWPALLYMFVEGAARELGGPRFIVGNHLVIEAESGVFALVAHLQRGSIRVKVGDRVRAGDVIALCGNSGNSTEPHVHAQLMDRRSPLTGQGLPMTFGGEPLPPDGEHLK
ncbi:biotin carboxyl carrier protein [Microbacteriaceae bacterium SG_E_30_P1]|uniref:Biotin carboxyl carrier protein n=1 Tax=Antiquaquibacter oligotrophicus TaxID=2880260 RepID=A0ABT6KT74_9MICO|nr:M23 family metallopeptidase [Antiquaquibacter oligotrophicus]MDH6182277.1 biotin carboxyl carrier protein [Antiquaquibacter oligotrophicus]UDF12066.1 M23 family metallopeptidase [Antiquaquibacter oligotrophicus]